MGDFNQVDALKRIVEIKVFNFIIILFLLDQIPDGIGDIGKKTGKVIMSGFQIEIVIYSIMRSCFSSQKDQSPGKGRSGLSPV